MRIAALQKTTLIDFPHRISALVFTQGCNFHCPYCHNPDLVGEGTGLLPAGEVTAFLAHRRTVLEGVVISGGEPTLQADLPDFCAIVRDMGYAVKLDTNGSHPEMLRSLLERGLLEYVALDVKASPRAYPEALCTQGLSTQMAQSLSLLREAGVPHEFRVTCVSPFITPESFANIIDAVGSNATIFLQKVRLKRVLRPDFFLHEGAALPQETIDSLQHEALRAGLHCFIR